MHYFILGKSPTSTPNPTGIHWSKDSKDSNRASRAKSHPSRSGSPYRPLCCFRSSKNWSPSWAGKLGPMFFTDPFYAGNGWLGEWDDYILLLLENCGSFPHSLLSTSKKSGRKEENSQSRHFQTLKMCKINWEKNMPKPGNTSCFQQLKTEKKILKKVVRWW